MGAGCKTTWSQRLELLFADLSYAMKVVNLAVRGSSSRWVSGSTAAVQRKALERADIVLVDYTISDFPESRELTKRVTTQVASGKCPRPSDS